MKKEERIQIRTIVFRCSLNTFGNDPVIQSKNFTPEIQEVFYKSFFGSLFFSSVFFFRAPSTAFFSACLLKKLITL